MGLFGRKKDETHLDVSGLVKSAVLMEEDMYWKMIADSLAEGKEQDAQQEFLVDALAKLTPEEMIGFDLRTGQLLDDSYTSEMWCAGYILNGGCSDDCFDYFRSWVISRGKEVYYKAKADPDSLISEVTEGLDEYDFEDFMYVAHEAFELKTGKDILEYIDYENLPADTEKTTEIVFNWEEENLESMERICPKLFAAFWED